MPLAAARTAPARSRRARPLAVLARRARTLASGTDTWTYSWDPDGNLTSKTDGTDTWTYTWNEDNRLFRVEGPDSLDVVLEYDNMGRILRRVAGSNTTLMEWDGWDLVQETAQDGTVTRFFCPEGEMHRFQRGNDFYSVCSDAMGCVRLVIDAAGRVLSRFEYGAFGETLESRGDNIGNFPYRFVGSLGCRVDDALGLIYMRNRWYEPSISSFLSRDPLGQGTLYDYVRNSPVDLLDPLGLKPAKLTKWDRCGNAVQNLFRPNFLVAGTLAAIGNRVIPAVAKLAGVDFGGAGPGEPSSTSFNPEKGQVVMRIASENPLDRATTLFHEGWHAANKRRIEKLFADFRNGIRIETTAKNPRAAKFNDEVNAHKLQALVGMFLLSPDPIDQRTNRNLFFSTILGGYFGIPTVAKRLEDVEPYHTWYYEALESELDCGRSGDF